VVSAQLTIDNPSKEKALSNLGLSSSLIHKISDKGIYNVTIKSGYSSLPTGLTFEIVFLNASSSATTRGISTPTGITVPFVIEHVIPVKSFDIRITSPEGQELFKNTNEIPQGGRIWENVNLNNYTGNLTIGLDNILPVSDSIKEQIQLASNQTDVRDSVKIEAQVVRF
jgi:hypothetical protein